MIGLNTKLTLITLGILTIGGLGFKLYFDYANGEIQNLIEENKTLEIKYTNVKSNYNDLKKRIDDIDESLTNLQIKSNEIIKENDEDKIIFEDHDLEVLLKAKPSLMEKKINKAIQQRFDDFEKL